MFFIFSKIIFIKNILITLIIINFYKSYLIKYWFNGNNSLSPL